MADPTPGSTAPPADCVWAVLANMRSDRPYGPRAAGKRRSGTRLFAGGAKLYVVSDYPGMCEKVTVLGRHRRSKSLIEAIVNVRDLEGFRPKLVFTRNVVERLQANAGTPYFFSLRADAERACVEYHAWQRLNVQLESGHEAPAIDTLWRRLYAIRSLRYTARSCLGTTNWEGLGIGRVTVSRNHLEDITFDESGFWHLASGRSLEFTNTYRWTRRNDLGTVGLEHLRFGTKYPVHLFSMSEMSRGCWKSVEGRTCDENRYDAELLFRDSGFRLRWRVTGPACEEQVDYHYCEV